MNELELNQLGEALRLRDLGKSEGEILAQFSGAAREEIAESLAVLGWIEAEGRAVAVPRAGLEAALGKIRVAARAAAQVPAAASVSAAAKPPPLSKAIPLSPKMQMAKAGLSAGAVIPKPSTDSAMKKRVSEVFPKKAPAAGSESPKHPVSLMSTEGKGWAHYMSSVSWRTFLPVGAVAALALMFGIYRGFLPAASGPSQVAFNADNANVSVADNASATPDASPRTVAVAPKSASLAAPDSDAAAAGAPSSAAAQPSSGSMTPDQAYSALAAPSDQEANAVSGSDSDIAASNSKSFSSAQTSYDENTI